MLVGKLARYGNEGASGELHPLEFGIFGSNYKKLSGNTHSDGTMISEITTHFTTILGDKGTIELQIWNGQGS